MANTATGAAEAGEKEFFTTLLDMLHEGAAIIDEQGDILAENAQWSQYFSAPTAMPPHEKQNFVSLLSSDRLVLNLQDKERLRENFSQVAAGVLPECAGTYEHSGRGSWWWLRAHLKQFNHRSRRLVLVRLEKLELVTRENGAEGPAAFYRALLEDLPVWLYICDRDERFVWANLEFRRRFGLALTEIVGRKIEEIIPPEAQSRLRELRHRCYETGTEQSETLRFQVNDQESVMHFHYLPVLDSDGSVAYLVSACRDMTHQTKVEESRAMTQRLLNEIIERMPIAFLAVNHEFHILRANRAACELFGYTREELVGMHVHKLVPAQFHERHSALMHDFAASASVGLAMHERGDVLGLKRDGSEFPMLASVLKMAWGDFPLYGVMIVDMTRFRKAEKQLLEAEAHLQQMQKQEALGQLAGNIAHDFNNLMAIVLGYADMIQEKTHLPREIGIMMSEIKKAVQRGAALTKQILAYAKHQQLQVKPMSLHALVESHVFMLQSLLTASVRLELALEAQRDMVALDQGQFMQVLLNLAVNARDAMPMGGSFRIATALKSLDETFFHDRHIVPQAGDFLLLTVTDSGHGMSPEILARIFDPYFTTKSRDKGTGLGLSMVYGIIKQLGGFIFCHSTPGAGTTFEIYLPLCTEDVEQSVPANRTQGTVSFRDKYRDLTVLVVDDEDAMRGIVVAYLQSAGITVHQASNGRAALDFIDGFAGKLDIIITDIMMPEMNGLDMAEEALLLQPETSVIFISGYSKELLMSRPNNQNFRLLVKPFSREALFAEIDLVLSTRHGSSFGGTSTGEYSI